jgi:cytochrome c oxidase subunit 3
MVNLVTHPFHLVDESPWPIATATRARVLALSLVKWFHTSSFYRVVLCSICLLSVVFQWWADVCCEASFQGLHTKPVQDGIRIGIMLFIIREVIFFVSFFWAFFHRRLRPSHVFGHIWPPLGVSIFDPLSIPALNTLILISSGVSATWAHRAVSNGQHYEAVWGLITTIILGLYFTALQCLEYLQAWFTIADSVFGSVFFIATGFHGFHVLVGTTFLVVILLRLHWGHFSPAHHLGLEMACWYWHFVDVVWIFLYIWVYCWRAVGSL